MRAATAPGRVGGKPHSQANPIEGRKAFLGLSLCPLSLHPFSPWSGSQCLRGNGEVQCQELLSSTQDSLPEWSKGVDSNSTSASCVGSNPTAVRHSCGKALPLGAGYHGVNWATALCEELSHMPSSLVEAGTASLACLCPLPSPIAGAASPVCHGIGRYTHRGARTHDHKVKGLALCRLS